MFLPPCYFINLTMHMQFLFVFLSTFCCSETCYFTNLSFCLLTILSTYYFVNLPFCQLSVVVKLVILPTCHFVNLTIHQLAIYQLAIFSTCHFINLIAVGMFINLPFCSCSLVIFLYHQSLKMNTLNLTRGLYYKTLNYNNYCHIGLS